MRVPKRLAISMATGTIAGTMFAVLGVMRSMHDTPATYPHTSLGTAAFYGAVVGLVTGVVFYLTRTWRERDLRWYRRSWIVSLLVGLLAFLAPAVIINHEAVWPGVLVWLIIGISGGYGMAWVMQSVLGPPKEN